MSETLTCPYCTGTDTYMGSHATKAERTACYRRWMAQEEELERNPRCRYCGGPPHPQLLDKLNCERAWVENVRNVRWPA